MLQLGVVIILLFLLVKKLPALCNGLLSGNPSLSGGDVAGTLTKAVGVAAAAVVTGGAGAAAGAAGATGGVMAKTLGAMKGGMGAMGRGAMNYALTQNPLGQSFAQGMNLFSGNGTSPGLAQKGGLSQALGLTTTNAQGKPVGLVDKMKGDTGDKPKDGEKPQGNSTSNNNNQNQNTPAATGKDGGKETIEKQIGTVSKQLDRVERMLQGLNPNTPARNLNMPKLPTFSTVLPQGSTGGLQYSKLSDSTPGNISSDGKFAKAQVMSPKGNNSTIAWIPVEAPASGRVSHTAIAPHKKGNK